MKEAVRQLDTTVENGFHQLNEGVSELREGMSELRGGRLS